MTLCLAWRSKKDTIHFASDSRVWLGEGIPPVDVGIKLFSIPVKINTAVKHDSGEQSNVFDYSFGMCFAGSALNGYVLKETLSEIMTNLQFTDYTDTSIEGLCKLIAKFYGHISTQFCYSLAGDRGEAKFIIAGRCPKTKELKAFEFTRVLDGASLVPDFVEILTDIPLVMIGSGANRATELLIADGTLSPFHVLRSVVKDTSVPSVGGNLQYGVFENFSFKVKGVIDFDDDTKSIKKSFRGQDLYEGEFSTDFDEFFPARSFAHPFQQEIDIMLSS